MRKLITRKFPASLLLLLLSFVANAQASNTNDDWLLAPMLVIGIAFIAIMIGVIISGCLLAAIAVATLAGLVTVGIISAGVLAAWQTKSVTAGFKTVAIASCALAGSFAGVIFLFIINFLFHLTLYTDQVWWIGLLAGFTGGLLIGNLLAKAGEKLLGFVKRRYLQ